VLDSRKSGRGDLKRYWLAWLNESVKFLLGIYFLRIEYVLWFAPASTNDKALGIGMGLLLGVAIMILIDLPFSIWAIHKGNHKLLKVKK
jgi:hypothetical protein